jgi:DNA-binding NarL/FixJ family response regulator
MGIRIIIANNYPSIRRILCDLLESHHDLEVIGQAENGKDAVELCLSLISDIAIVDVHMPSLNGIEVVHQITPKLSQLKVLVLSGDTNFALSEIFLGRIHRDIY